VICLATQRGSSGDVNDQSKPRQQASWPGVDVEAAAERLRGLVRRTPLLEFGLQEGKRIYVKPESLQPIGSFKIRGAMNFLALLEPEVRSRGVVAHSSGNHAQGVAAAAKAFGVSATIVIPEGAPAVKVANTLALGATVVSCEPSQEGREGTVAEIAAKSGATIVHPYDHPDVISGQGTVGLEILADLPDVANVIVPIGGGGLSAGVCAAFAARGSKAQIIGVEPAFAADAKDSLSLAEPVRWTAEQVNRTMADGVRTQQIGRLNHAILQQRLAGVVTVSEEAIAEAVRWYASSARLVVEPTGALSFAALRRLLDKGTVDGLSLAPGDTVVVVSGGNVDLQRLCDILLNS